MDIRVLAGASLLLTTLSCAPDASSPAEPASPALATAPGTWVERADLLSNQQKRMTAATVTNGRGQSIAYVIGWMNGGKGEYSKVYAYNAATDKWTRKADLPAPRYWSNGAVVIDGRIYVTGGETAPKAYLKGLVVYDPAADTWTPKRGMPAQGLMGVSGAIDGKLYVLTYCGFEDCVPLVPQAFYRYDPATDRWSTRPSPAGFHMQAVGGAIGGKFYVAGGSSTSELEVYDPATNAWSFKAPLGSPRWAAAGTVAGGKLYVIGGVRVDTTGTGLVPTTSVYDPVTDTWTHRARLPVLLWQFAAARVVVGGQARIEVFGGPAPGNNLQLIP